MKAVSKINHQGGWLTAEVEGGDRLRLKDVSERMDKIISYL
jgi:hexulose-6-phosphate isomerase